MNKRLLSAVFTMVFCVSSAAAADFGTLTVSRFGEVTDDTIFRKLAQADEPGTLTLHTPDGETGTLTFDGINYHLRPCGQTEEYTYPVLFSADSENIYGLPYTDWFLADTDLSDRMADEPLAEWAAYHICSVPRWTDCGTQKLTKQGAVQPPTEPLTRFLALRRDPKAALALTLRRTLGQPLLLTCNEDAYTLTIPDSYPLQQTRWTQLAPLPRENPRTLILTLLNGTEQYELLTYLVTPPYLDADFAHISIAAK